MQINQIIERREHLTLEGLSKIVARRASINRGLSDKLNLAAFFPDVVQVKRPLVEHPQKIDPHWLAGFTSAEGCFFINISASQTHSVGFKLQLIFVLSQDSRDVTLLLAIIEFLKCGNIYRKTGGDVYDLRVSKFGDITSKIIPFFKKHQIIGVKARDFEDWCKAAEFMKQKKHLTLEGLEEIRKIKAGMNRGMKLD